LNVTIGALKNIVTDKPAPITAPLKPEAAATSAAQRPGDHKLIQLEKKHHHKRTRKTLPDDNRNADGTIVNGGDTVSGMAGNEQVHGENRPVGGNHVTFAENKKNRITGLYSEDPLPTFSWWDGYNKEHHEENASLGQVDMHNLKNYGLQAGEDMGMDELMLDGHRYDLS
jgi:hypothetical protein